MANDDYTVPVEPLGGLDTRFCEVMDAAPVMIWVTGPDKSFTFFNKTWLTFTGRSLEQELGDGWASGVHPEDVGRCYEIFSAAFEARRKGDQMRRTLLV